MITLTPKQEEVLMIVSEQEGRHPSQMLSLLMDNGVDFGTVIDVLPLNQREVLSRTHQVQDYGRKLKTSIIHITNRLSPPALRGWMRDSHPLCTHYQGG